MDKNTALVKAIAEINEEEALGLVRQCLAEGAGPLEILELSRQAMDIIGERYDCGEYFLPELIIAGDLLGQIAQLVKPLLEQTAGPKGKEHTVVIGTVAGDLHDIGKNIVVLMLEVNGFKVVDLGVDVPAQKFVEAIGEHKPEVVAMSGFLTMAFDAMKDTVAAIAKAGLRDQVKIMVGGGQVDEVVREYTGADAYGANATAAVTLAHGWTRKPA
jgi:5-methyltetrahydrofolate--homocysteine methyltransferase